MLSPYGVTDNGALYSSTSVRRLVLAKQECLKVWIQLEIGKIIPAFATAYSFALFAARNQY